MDTPSLRAFITIAKLGSVSAAAEALHLTQPAVSKRLSALEEKLGVSLFHRTHRKLKLSQAGQALLPRAKQVLIEIEDAARTLSYY